MSIIEAKMSRYGVDARNSDAINNNIINPTSTILSSLNMSSDLPLDDGQVDEFSRFSRPLLTVAATFTILIMITGILGNLLTIVALLRSPKIRNVAADFIISLCAADCLFCLLVLPFMAHRFVVGAWTFGDFLCTMVPFVQYGNVGVSLLCIAMITINRYIMIAHHSIYARVYRKLYVYIMIVFCWVFSYGFQLPTLFQVWGKFGYDELLETCSIVDDVNGRSSKTALFIIAFVIPCIIIIICYAKIFWVVHKSEQRMRNHASSQANIPNNQRQMPGSGNDSSASNNNLSSAENRNNERLQHTKSSRLKDHREAKQKRNEWRITKMVLAIFLSFLACYLPITIIKVADKNVNYPGLHIFGYIMIYFSACINNFIYFIMNKQYRQAYKSVVMCKTPRLLSFHGVSSNCEKTKNTGYKFNNTSNSMTMVSSIEPADMCRVSLSQPDTPKHLNAIPDSKEPSESC